MICKICGLPMAHYRLYGYQCRNPEHNRESRHGLGKPPTPYGMGTHIKKEPVPYDDTKFEEPPFFDDDLFNSLLEADVISPIGEHLPFDDLQE